MSARICPKCGTKLTKHNNYFCGYCGELLAPSLVQDPELNNVSIAKYDVIASKNIFSIFLGLFTSKLFLIGFFIISLFISYFFLMSAKTPKNEIKVTNINNSGQVCDKDFKCGEFGQNSIGMYVPSTVTLYFEGFDVEKLTDYIVDFDPSYTLLVKEFKELKSSHIGMFVENIDGKLFITFLIFSNQDPTNGIISAMNNSDKLFIGRVADFYVISTRSDVFLDIQKSKDGIIKNLMHNNDYAVVIGKKEKGQLLILKNGIEGDATIDKFINKISVPSYIKLLLGKIYLEKDNYIII